MSNWHEEQSAGERKLQEILSRVPEEDPVKALPRKRAAVVELLGVEFEHLRALAAKNAHLAHSRVGLRQGFVMLRQAEHALRGGFMMGADMAAEVPEGTPIPYANAVDDADGLP